MPDVPRRRRRRRRRKSRTGRALWMASALFIVYGTSIPFNFSWDTQAAAAKLANLPLDIFLSPDTQRRVSIPDTVQNILLFIPFGAFGAVALRRRLRAFARVALVTASGALLSASVEVVQLFTVDRTSSLNDLATNTTGTLIGATLAPIVVAIVRRVLAALGARGLTASPSLYPLLLMLVVLPIAAWHPFDASLDIGTLWPKVKTLVSDPWQFSVMADEGMDFLRYALLGAALAIWLSDTGWRRPGLIAAAVGALAAAAFESGQLIVESRMPGLKDMLVQGAGAVAGALIAIPARTTWPPVLGVAIVGLACTAGAAMQMLSPFEWTRFPRGFVWTPFLAYYQFTSVQTVTHVVELMLLFLPLGFVLTLVTSRMAVTAVLMCTLLLVVPLEYMQGWVRGRFPDVTDIGVTLLGALLGAWLAGPGWAKFSRELRRRRQADEAAEQRQHPASAGGFATGVEPAPPQR